MSAALRVAHAAETIRARWERNIASDPQTEAAQALEDTCQLLDPEVAEELKRLRVRLDEVHRIPQDTLTPAEVRLSQYAQPPRVFESSTEQALFQIACALRDTLEETRDQRNAARLKVLGLEEERHSTNEALDDAVQELRRRETGPALPWAHTMPDDDLSGFLNDLVSAAVNRWQSDPEVPDRETLAAVEKACAEWRTPGQGYRSDEDEPAEVPPLVVFRASHDSIVMGLYTTAAEARKHCETDERRSWGPGHNLVFDWIEDEDDGVAELVVTAGQNEESTTGYVVEAREVASAYDPDADE
ncbi:hypothetical protein [Streptomyces scabiei]|uniref:hypothetical protein n=1 Tax=Streptomyces scabiei TaxID=1930 RepID=UPI0038F6E571